MWSRFSKIYTAFVSKVEKLQNNTEQRIGKFFNKSINNYIIKYECN